MSARDGFVLGCRLLAIYFLVDGIVNVIHQLVYTMGLDPGRESTPYLYLPNMAVPTIYIFSALLLWIYSPQWAEKMFPVRLQSSQQAYDPTVSKTLTRLLAVYLILTGISSILDFFVKFLLKDRNEFAGVLSRPPTWDLLVWGMAWLVGGLVVYFGAGRVIGAAKHLGNAVADDLWRIKPEDDEPKTQA